MQNGKTNKVILLRNYYGFGSKVYYYDENTINKYEKDVLDNLTGEEIVERQIDLLYAETKKYESRKMTIDEFVSSRIQDKEIVEPTPEDYKQYVYEHWVGFAGDMHFSGFFGDYYTYNEESTNRQCFELLDCMSMPQPFFERYYEIKENGEYIFEVEDLRTGKRYTRKIIIDNIEKPEKNMDIIKEDNKIILKDKETDEKYSYDKAFVGFNNKEVDISKYIINENGISYIKIEDLKNKENIVFESNNIYPFRFIKNDINICEFCNF